MRRPLCCLLLFALWALRLPAQQRWLFSHLGKREGLASDIVFGTQQDAKGYIWIATADGLERYDGQRFVLYKHKVSNPNSIPGDMVLQPLIDRQNRLWLLFQYNQVGYMDLNDMHFHEVSVPVEKAVLQKAEGRLERDADGRIMIVLKRTSILTYDEKNNAFSTAANPFLIPQGWHPASLSQDPIRHNYWIGCDSGLVKYNVSARTLSYRGHNADMDPVVEHFKNIRYFFLPYMDRQGRFWMQTWQPTGWYEFNSYDVRTGKEKKWEKSISKMMSYRYTDTYYFGEFSDGAMWIGGTNLLGSLKKSSDNFEPLESQLTGEFNLHYDIVRHLMEDREHNIWISTDKGLYRFNPSAQIFHTIASRRPGRDTIFTPDVTAALETRKGTVLVATWGNGVFAYDSNMRSVHHPVTSLSVQNREIMTWCLYERKNGDIWRGNQDGMLAIWHAATGKQEKMVPPIFRNSTIRQIVEDKMGNIWLATQKGDVIKWHPSDNSFSLVMNLGSSVQRMYVDRHGDIWACTTKTGLFAIDPADDSIRFNYTSDGPEGFRLSNIGCTDIIQYSDSLFAIASGGLHILNEYTHRMRFVEPINGVPGNTITNLVMDKRGYIWIATESGLCKINMRNEARSIFNEADGVGTNSFNTGSSLLLRDGRIALGTSHDMMIFQPADITSENQQPPDMEIGNIALMNRWLPMDSLTKLDRLKLPYDQNGLRIVFSSLTYQNTYAIQYKLENLDKEWITAETGEVTYNYIPPGDYTFKVRASNSEGVSSIHTREIRVTVVAPFWRTWAFYAITVLTAAALLYWFDRLRMKRKEALQAIRTNISGNLHQDIHTALQHINLLSEVARIKAEKTPEQSVNYINEIHHKSRSMIIALEDMLWSIDPINDNMERAIARMREYAGALAQQPDIKIEVQADDKVFTLKPDMRARHELMQVYRLSLRLLVEEMKARHTTVQLDFERSRLILSFFSAGLRPDNSNHLVKLLDEMKTRAASIGGTLDLHFDDKGAAVIFICPSIS